MIQIVPSILSADFARLAEDVARMEQAGATMLHVDVMDGHFVPNLTLGPPVVKSLRKVTDLALDVHLMITDPDKFAPLFIEAGAWPRWAWRARGSSWAWKSRASRATRRIGIGSSRSAR